MRSGTGSWLLSGAVLGAIAVFALSEMGEAAQIYPLLGGQLHWHLSIPVSVPPGPSIPGGGPLGATPNSDDHLLYTAISIPNPNLPGNPNYELTITDVTYDFHDLDLAQSPLGRAAARVQVTLREEAQPPNSILNPTAAPASGAFTTYQRANANLYWSFVGYPNAGQEACVLDSSSFFLIRDLFFDGGLSAGPTGQAVRSDGLGNLAGLVSPLDQGSNSLDFNSQGVATDCHNFETGLFVPFAHQLHAGVRVHSFGGPGGPGPSGLTSLTTGGNPGFVWLHMQGRMR